MIFQFTGLSGAGKTTLAKEVQRELEALGLSVKVLDGDQIRKKYTEDLGFSKADRIKNIIRMGELASQCVEDVVLMAVINPYQEAREHLAAQHRAKLIWIDCPIEELIKRDTKGLYKKAFLPEDHPEKIFNLTGINDPFELPEYVGLKVNTFTEDIKESTRRIRDYIIENKDDMCPGNH